jgi:hypothetical protein
LLQLASMCSSNREEFVNTVRDSWLIRFDDPGFILGERAKIRNDPAVQDLKYWTYEDAAQFDTALSSSEIVIAALFGVVSKNYYASFKGVMVRIAEPTLRRLMQKKGRWLLDNFRQLDFNVAEKLALVQKSLDRMAADSPAGSKRFALGVNTKKMPAAAHLASLGWPGVLRQEAGMASWLKALNGIPPASRPVAIRHIFNLFLKDYCQRTSAFTFVDVEGLTAYNDIQDPDPETGKFLPDHLTRRGYINIASFVAQTLAGTETDTAIIDAA